MIFLGVPGEIFRDPRWNFWEVLGKIFGGFQVEFLGVPGGIF